LKPTKISFSRVIREATLIFASVFIAIWLESSWQNYKNVTAARVSLGQIFSELQADRAFLEEVQEDQKALLQKNEKLLSWLANPMSLPNDLVHETLEEFGPALTIWPRRAAWTTMVASGQLGLLNDRDLVRSLGNYYEYRVSRLVYNGEEYDHAMYELEREAIPKIWDFEHKKLLTSEHERIAIFRGKIYRVNIWTRWYLGYVEEHSMELDTLIHDVEQHLKSHG
jgi:hypothetical protein